jgi:hypothetical protein
MSRTPRLSVASITGLIGAVAIASTLAFAATASAQSGFQAVVTAKDSAPKPCPNGEFLCGTADVANYGPAAWTFSLTSLTVEGTCDSYAATVTFELADRSALVLNEDGAACGPGQSNLSNASSKSFGHPGDASGNWTVQSADGRFTGLTGSGTDALHLAGAATAGTYSGSLG